MGLAWGSPHKVLSSGELPTQSPRKVFPVGIVWGRFAWVSETGVNKSTPNKFFGPCRDPSYGHVFLGLIGNFIRFLLSISNTLSCFSKYVRGEGVNDTLHVTLKHVLIQNQP